MRAAAATALPPRSPTLLTDGSPDARRAALASAAPTNPTGRPITSAGRKSPAAARRTTSNRAVGALPTTTTAPSGHLAAATRMAAAEAVVPSAGGGEGPALVEEAAGARPAGGDGHHLHVGDHGRPRPEGGDPGPAGVLVDHEGVGVGDVGGGVDHPGHDRPRRRRPPAEVDPLGEDPVPLDLDGVGRGHPPTSTMAPAGQMPTQSQQAVHRSSITSGLRGARRNARSGHVARHAPQAVQASVMRTAARRRR